MKLYFEPTPSKWSLKNPQFGICKKTGFTYLGHNVTNKKYAGSVRANCPVPKSACLYYFEAYIANSGRTEVVGVGLSVKETRLSRMPGWDYLSYAYHGDDGKLFCSNGLGETYGPTYTTGDTVGCGINSVTREIFFTKNGKNIDKKNLFVNPVGKRCYDDGLFSG